MVMSDDYSVFDDPLFKEEQGQKQEQEEQEYSVFDDPAFQDQPSLPVSEMVRVVQNDGQDRRVDTGQSTEQDLMGNVGLPQPQTQENRLSKVTEPFKVPVVGDMFGELPSIPVRKDSPDVQFAPPIVYAGDTPQVQQGLVLFTPYAGVNAMYEEFSSRHSDSDFGDKKRAADENNLAENIVATVFVDATSELAGRRQYDKLAEAIGAPESTRDYRAAVDRDLFTPSFIFKPLTDREDYAEFAIRRVIKNLVEAGAPNSLITKVQKNYDMVKDDFDDLTAEDVMITAEGIRGRTAKTYAQMGTLLLNTILTPVSFTVAGFAGRTRNPGEPNKNYVYLQSATENDVSIFGNEKNTSRLQAAERIAGRSYQPAPEDRDLPGVDDSIKMTSSDIVYMSQDSVKKPWQDGLLKHIKKRRKELLKERKFPMSRALLDKDGVAQLEKRVEDEMPSVEQVYDFLKDFALFSYVDGLDSLYGEFLEGYPAVQPPAKGWARQQALRESGRAKLEEFSDQMRRTQGSAVLFSPTSEMAKSLEYHDALPGFIDSVNKERMMEQIKDGKFGELAQENPQMAMDVINAAQIDPNRYNTALKQFTRTFMTMIGPEETGKMALMSMLGAKKYLLPSMLPFAEVDGMFSFDAIDAEGLEGLGITNEDVDRFWNDMPGIASIFIPGVLRGTRGAVAPLVKGGISAIKAAPSFASVLKNRNLSPSQKLFELGKVVGGEYEALETGTRRQKSVPEQTSVARVKVEEAFPVVDTPTSLRSAANQARKTANAIQGDEVSRKSYNQIADSFDAAASIVDDMLLQKQKEAEAGERTFSIMESITPTLDRVDVSTAKPFEYAKGQVTVRKTRVNQIKDELNAEKTLIQNNAGKRSYRSPGQSKLDSLLRDMAIDAGYYSETTTKDGQSSIRVKLKKFKDDHVEGFRESIANRLADEGVTDPRVYRSLLPDYPVDGPKSISSLVFKGERSEFAFLKRAYDQEIRKVAKARGVSSEKVKSELNRLSVAEDMVANGVKDESMYALLGLDDVQSREYASRGKSRPEMPYVRPKVSGTELPFEGTIEASKPAMTASKFASDVPYGLTRVALGRRPANIISNRLNQVRGKSVANAVLPFMEASMLATLEFMKEPFAFTNFPSWTGDFVRYMYMNSTNNKGFSASFLKFFQNFMSPSSILGEELFSDVIRSQGRVEISEFQMRALAKRLGADEDAINARVDIDKSLKEVGLDQHSAGESVIKIAPRDTLAGRFKEAVATAFFAGEGAYVDVPDNSPSGKSRIYINELFDIEYKTPSGEFVNATTLVDTVTTYQQQIKTNTVRLNQIKKELNDLAVDGLSGRKAVADEAAAQTLERAGLMPTRRVPGSSTEPYMGGVAGNLGDRRIAKVQALEQERTALIDQNTVNKKLIKLVKDTAGSPEQVFNVVDGKVTGVTDIRFNFKKDIGKVIGDAEKTLLGVLNTYVRPIQSKIMSLGANLAAGADVFRLSVESARLKNAVAIRTGDGTPKIVKRFKGDNAKEKAAEFAQKVNEEYQAKGNKGVIASTVVDSKQSGRKVVVGKRDLKLEGYNAVEATARYMSAYFSETAVLDYMYSMFKKLKNGELTFDEMLQQDNMSATMVIASFPDNVVNKVKKDGMAPIDVARKLLKLVSSGAVAAPSAKGSGRFFKERLWAEKLPFELKKDFYALYSESSMATFSGLYKRVEHYRLLNSLRENGLILSKNEIDATPGVSINSNRFESMTRLSKKYPGLIDDVPGLFIERTVADGLIHQKNILDAVFETFEPERLNIGGLLTQANRQLKRLAVISYINGTMARNFTSGVLVQARMAEIPATMKYFRQALEANRAIRRGETPQDPIFLELSELLGGPGRGVRDLQMLREDRSRGAMADAQLDYVASVLSGDSDAPPLGEALNKVTSERKAITEPLVQAFNPDRQSAQNYGETINLSRLPGQEKFRAGMELESLPGTIADAMKTISDESVATYGGIDATLRLAYAYEVHVDKGVGKRDAAMRGRKVFYDHPDIPPIMQKLRDLPLLGFPFAGHMVWSTKAYANYFQKNPMKAMVDGVLLRATTEATQAVLNLGSTYESEVFETDEDFESLLDLPMITSARTTESDRKSLARGDAPPREESLFSIGALSAKLDPMFLGIQSDSTFKKSKRAYRDGTASPGELPLLAVGAAQQMLGDLVFTGAEGATKPATEEERITKRLTEATSPEDGGGFFSTISETLLVPLTFISSDARGLAKKVSASTGTPFAGQDASKVAAYTNALGLAMKVRDLRAYKENFNEIGQKQLVSLNDAIKEYAFVDRDLTTEKGRLKDRIKRDRVLKAITKIERADNIFNKKRAADGIRMRNNIVTLMKGMLKNRPDTPEFEISYQNLLKYFNAEGYGSEQTNMLEN